MAALHRDVLLEHLEVGVGDVAQRRDRVPAVVLESSSVLGQLVLGEEGWDIGGHGSWPGRSFVGRVAWMYAYSRTVMYELMYDSMYFFGLYFLYF